MSTVPASSNIALVSAMLAFFSTCLVITFQAPLIWWFIPLALTAVVVAIASVRWQRHRRMRAVMHGSEL